MAHCLLRGKNLVETIHLNLPSYDNLRRVYCRYSYDKKEKKDVFAGIDMGRPVWESFPTSPDDSASVFNATKTYLGRLIPISRWILLLKDSDQMYCCNGFKYDTHKDGFPAEPTAAVRLITKKNKKGGETTERRVVGINPEKATWRELSALLVKRAADGLGGPLAMANASSDVAHDFQVCAMTRDQASMDIGIESAFHIAPSFQLNFPMYSTEVEGAEKVSQKLRSAVETYRNFVDADWTPRVKRTQAKERGKLRNRLAQSALIFYWTGVEKNLHLLTTHIEAIGTENAMPTQEEWRKMLFITALEAYSATCGQETLRQMRAFAKGWQRLNATRDNKMHDAKLLKEDEG